MKTKKEVKTLKNNKIICRNCGGKFGYFKKKTNEFQCRDCGAITKLKEEEEDGIKC